MFIVIVLNFVLLGLCAVAIVLVQIRDRSDSAVEAMARRYALAISASDESAALAEIAPDQRALWTDFVDGQLGDQYVVTAVSVRSQPILDRLLHRGNGNPTEATVIMVVHQTDPEVTFQANARTPVSLSQGRWYLDQPPLTGDELPQPSY